MESIKFSSVQELYIRLKPALDCKEAELKKLGYKYIKAEDVWNALKKNKWSDSSNLTLHEMVNDILNTDALFFDNYVKYEFGNYKRKAIFDEEAIL